MTKLILINVTLYTFVLCSLCLETLIGVTVFKHIQGLKEF